jgi:hypothetical protein
MTASHPLSACQPVVDKSKKPSNKNSAMQTLTEAQGRANRILAELDQCLGWTGE